MKIKNTTSKFLVFCLVLLAISCSKSKKDILSENQIEITGIIKAQGATTYQYGTHTIQENNVLYALTSTDLNLDNYLNKNKTIIATKKEGYPISGGPIYLNVDKIK